MTIISEPNTTFNIVPASTAVENTAQEALMVCQMTAAGTATAGALNTDITLANIDAKGGAGGMAQDAFREFRRINTDTPLDVIFLDDPTGDAAVGEILWDGTCTTAGTITVGCGSPRNGVASVAVAVGDDGDDVATATTAAYALLTQCVCTVSTDAVTTDQNNFTYNHDGTEGNSIGLWVDLGTVAGITYTITAPTGGTGVPTLTSVFDVIGNKRYQAIYQPGSYGVANLVTLLDARWNVNNRVQDGSGIVTIADTSANHVTATNLLNSQNIMYQCEAVEDNSDFKGPSIKENLFARSATIAALKTLRHTDGSNISQYVNSAGGPKDATGGAHIGSLPYANTPLGYPVMEASYGFTDTQKEAIKTAGGFVAGNNTAGNAIILGEVVTTYKTDAAGTADISYKYQNYVDTMSIAREYFFNNFKAKCSGSRLTEGDLLRGYNMHNEASIKGLAKEIYGTLSGDGYVLLQAGDDALEYFEDKLDVSLDIATGWVTLTSQLPIVTQLRGITGTLQIAFSVN